MFSSEFGRREADPEREKVVSGMIKCDFSHLTLADGIRFLNIDMSTIKLPPFPHFTVLDPYKNTNFLKDSDAPEKLKRYFHFNDGIDWLFEDDKALIFDAHKLAKNYDMSLEALYDLLKDFEFIKV